MNFRQKNCIIFFQILFRRNDYFITYRPPDLRQKPLPQYEILVLFFLSCWTSIVSREWLNLHYFCTISFTNIPIHFIKHLFPDEFLGLFFIYRVIRGCVENIINTMHRVQINLAYSPENLAVGTIEWESKQWIMIWNISLLYHHRCRLQGVTCFRYDLIKDGSYIDLWKPL